MNESYNAVNNMDPMDILTKFKVVIPSAPKLSVSTAELRVAPAKLVFSHVTAAELGYPEYVCLLVSDDATKIVVKASVKNDYTVPFYKPACVEDKKAFKAITISNSALAKVIRKTMNWGEKGVYRVPAIKYPESAMLLFDLESAERSERHRDRKVTPEDVFNSYPSLNDIAENYHPVAALTAGTYN